MRGMLQGRDRLEEAIAALAANTMKRIKINIPWDWYLCDLAWDFDGKTKQLTDCTKEELIHVIKTLCAHVADKPEPSTADVYTK